jgi:hypothetical protein
VAGDISGLVAGQEEDRLGDVPGSQRGAFERGESPDHLFHLVHLLVAGNGDVEVEVGVAGVVVALAPGVDEHGRGDAEGGDAVDADAVRAELAGGVLGETDDGVLGGGVGVGPQAAEHAGDAGDGDDTPRAAGRHGERRVLHPERGAQRVDAEHAVELARVEGEDALGGARLAAQHPGVVAVDVEAAAVARQRPVHGALDVLLHGHVAAHEADLRAQRRRQRLPRRVVDVRDHHPGPVLHEQPHDGLADPPRAAGHNGHLPVHPARQKQATGISHKKNSNKPGGKKKRTRLLLLARQGETARGQSRAVPLGHGGGRDGGAIAVPGVVRGRHGGLVRVRHLGAEVQGRHGRRRVRGEAGVHVPLSLSLSLSAAAHAGDTGSVCECVCLCGARSLSCGLWSASPDGGPLLIAPGRERARLPCRLPPSLPPARCRCARRGGTAHSPNARRRLTGQRERRPLP